MDLVLAKTFLYLAEGMTSRALELHSVIQKRRFHALFAISPEDCSAVWRNFGRSELQNGQPVQLLWGLLFMKTYASEDVLCGITRSDRKTFRKWSWKVVDAISN